jgi:hypothetical protein
MSAKLNRVLRREGAILLGPRDRGARPPFLNQICDHTPHGQSDARQDPFQHVGLLRRDEYRAARYSKVRV